MKAGQLLRFELALMAWIVAFAVVAPHRFVALLARPELYVHAKFVHVLAVTLFFANVVIGTLWETKSLRSGRPEIVRFTYETVAWLDAFFTVPLILVAVLSGLMLGTLLGGVFSMGWLVLALALFVLSGVVWLAFDIPSQYRAKKLSAALPSGETTIAPELLRVLRFRRSLNLITIVPLLVVFGLMVHKPDIAILRPWLAPSESPGAR